MLNKTQVLIKAIEIADELEGRQKRLVKSLCRGILNDILADKKDVVITTIVDSVTVYGKVIPFPNLEEQHLCDQSKKLEAAKSYKNRTYFSLMDSKRILEFFCYGLSDDRIGLVPVHREAYWNYMNNLKTNEMV